MLINRDFSGKLNLDVQDFKVPAGDYTYALNITKDSLGEGQDRVVANILGNRKVNYTLPSGDNKEIGHYPDLVRNKIYYFIWNSNNFHSILAYNRNTDTISKVLESKTDSGGVDILNFNPSYKVNSINVIHRDESEGDLLFFNDGLNQPRRINVGATYSTWLEEYLDVAKPCPQMAPKVVYVNDTNVTINNLKNKLFQFSYRWVFENYEKSVWSEFSAVPLPFDYDDTYADDPTKNNKIAIYLSTGSLEVKKIEVAVREIVSGATTDWQLFEIIDKDELSISDDEFYLTHFKNDGLYTPIDLTEFNEIQDYVPLKANAAEMLNGNTPIYGGITEGYNKVNADIEVNIDNALPSLKYEYAGVDEITLYVGSAVVAGTTYNVSFDYVSNAVGDASPKNISYLFSGGGDQNTIANSIASLLSGNNIDAQNLGGGLIRVQTINGVNGSITNVVVSVSVGAASDYFLDYSGTLFTAFCKGVDSGTQGTQIKIVLNGFQVNADDLLNGRAKYVINAINGSGSSIGVEYSYTSGDQVSVSTLLGNIQAALISNGWTFVSLSNGVLTMNYAGGFTLFSSGLKLNSSSINRQTTQFAYPYDAGATFQLMYFDSKGRTNGVTYDVDGNFKTPSGSNAVDFPQPQLIINHRPPTWAVYYKIVRTNNTTYQKRLQWISDSAYSDSASTPSGDRYVYIGISNIDLYNNQIEGTKGIVSYSYQQGDRIRITNRYSALGVLNAVEQVDYEVLGLETNPVINGAEYSGNFVKVKYPQSLPTGILFDGTADYQNYEILLYSIRQTAADTKKLYFEFGKCFGIGNAGTANAYHIGLDQTQSADLATPAKITLANGDLFFRKRTIPLGTRKTFSGSGLYTTNFGTVSPFWMVGVPVGTITNGNFTFRTQNSNAASNAAGVFPTNASNECVFNNTGANPCFLRLAGTIPVTSDASASYALIAKITTASTTTIQTVMEAQSITLPDAGYNFEFDRVITVPANAKVFLLSHVLGRTATPPNVGVGSFNLTAEAYTKLTIPIIEQSFSDTYNLVGNSNGRASAVDENAKQTYYPTLVRFGQSYQADTSINGTNRFLFDNFDTYDRSFGDVRRLHVRDRYMKVYQKFKVGNVPVLTQIVKDVQGNPLQAESDRLINKIQYYSGEYGIGDSPNSLAWNNFADYFVDDYRGVVCRLGQEGITPLSIVHETNAFFVDKLKAYRTDLNNGIAATGQTYKGDPQVYGVFDAATNKYIIMMEQITRYSNPSTISFQQEGYTVCFDERLNGFESFYSWKPEGATCLGTLLVSFKEGELWKHDSTTYCNFYGTQYQAEIDGAFNDNMLQKKTFISLSELSSGVWTCPEISTQMYSYGTTKQQSNLIVGDFKLKEGQYHATFKRDSNSQRGLINGETLKGQYILIKFRATNPSQFVYLSGVSVKYIPSPLTNR